jgi:hypothetical protein
MARRMRAAGANASFSTSRRGRSQSRTAR